MSTDNTKRGSVGVPEKPPVKQEKPPKEKRLERPPTAGEKLVGTQSALSETHERIVQTTQSIDKTTQHLAQVRETLGLQPLETDPSSISSDKAYVGYLETRKAELASQEKILQIEKRLSPEDEVAFQRIIESVGGTEKLFDPKGKFLHTTDNLSFAEILKSGSIITDEVAPGGKQRTPGASFTDGNFSEAASFQLLYDNIPGGGKEKQLNSEQYADAIGGTHAENFIRYFWNNHLEEAKPYLEGLAKKIPQEALVGLGLTEDRSIKTEQQAIALGKFFTPKGKGDYGVTVVFSAEKSDALGIEDRGTVGLQKFFEKRSYKPGGVPLSEASVFLVPESRVAEMRHLLDAQGLNQIAVRSTEELEARILMEKMENHSSE